MAIPSQEIGYGTEEKLLWQISKQIQNLIGVTYNSGSGFSTTYVPYTGATSNVNLGSYNISANSFINGFSSITASGTQVVLTVNSAPEILVSGSGGQTIKLPDATTLANGTTFSFNNNQSSGAITVNNNSNTLVLSIPSGGYAEIMLLSNSIAAGSWDRHFQAPSNVSWSTNTLDYPGSITSATWNGNVIQPNRGGTGQSTYTDGQLLIGNTTGNTLSKSTLTAGTGISIANGNGTITITATGAVSGAVTGSGTTNYVPKFTSSTVVGNSNIQDSGTLITLGSNTTISSGGLSIGSSATVGGTSGNLNLNKNITGGILSYAVTQTGIVQSDVTSLGISYLSSLNTQAATFTLAEYRHFSAAGAVLGSGSALTIQTGYHVGTNHIQGATNYGFRGAIPVGTNRYNLYMDGSALNYLEGNLGIGILPLANYSLYINKNLTSGSSVYGIAQTGAVQSDLNNGSAFGILNQFSTQAATFTLAQYIHFRAVQGTIGSGSTITEQVGFSVANNLTSATTNYGFQGSIPSGSNRWNIYMDGTANNYLNGSLLIGTTTDTGEKLQITGTTKLNGNTVISSGGLGIGTAALSGYSLNVAKNITGNVISYGIGQSGVSQSDVTNSAYGFTNASATAAGAYTLSQYFHYSANQGTIGAGSAITTQIAFDAGSSLIGATNNYGFRGRIPSGTGRWNIFMDGTADNYMAGALGIATTSLAGYGLRLSKTMTGGVNTVGYNSDGVVQSDSTISAAYYSSFASTVAASFTIGALVHFNVSQGTIGLGSTVTNQYGFLVNPSLIGATNNFGFFGNIPSGTGRYNLYMNGTADNYLAGSLGIGNTSLTGYNLRVAKNITGSTTGISIRNETTFQSDVTSLAIGYSSFLGTQASAFTLSTLVHYTTAQGTIGSGSTVTNQYGFYASSGLTGATNNYGFFSEIPSGTNRWNIYMNSTAQNYLGGALSIGVTTANASALLQVDSTTQGVLFPRMTTTQKNAISSPATGLVVFDTTLGKLCVFSTTWQTISSS